MTDVTWPIFIHLSPQIFTECWLCATPWAYRDVRDVQWSFFFDWKCSWFMILYWVQVCSIMTQYFYRSYSIKWLQDNGYNPINTPFLLIYFIHSNSYPLIPYPSCAPPSSLSSGFLKSVSLGSYCLYLAILMLEWRLPLSRHLPCNYMHLSQSDPYTALSTEPDSLFPAKDSEVWGGQVTCPHYWALNGGCFTPKLSTTLWGAFFLEPTSLFSGANFPGHSETPPQS